jgi:PAS domain S-box-containing protein
VNAGTAIVAVFLPAAVVAAGIIGALTVALRRAQQRLATSHVLRTRSLEADLQRTKDRLELAVRSSDLSIWEYETLNGRIDNCSPILINFWEQLGYDPATVPTLFAAAAPMVLTQEGLMRVPQEIQAYLDGSTPRFEQEHQVRHKDGSLQWRLSRGMAVRDQDGKPVRFIGSHVDITRLKQIEADLLAAREAAELANRAKDEFLANVSHEIRTPMNAILGMTEVALESAPTEQQRQLLSTVESAAKNLLGIINDLLDVSKIGAGKLVLDQTDLSVRAVVGDTARALAPRAHRKGLAFLWDVRPDVPDSLFGDAGRLRQVLMNLIGNAIKFTERGEVVVEVTTAGGEAGATPGESVVVRFAVRDTGIGIPREKQPTIFRAFEQADPSTTRKYGGTGLGLTIASQLAALMGGEITVDSEPGRGSTFVLTAQFAHAPSPDVADPPPPSLSPDAPRTRRVLDSSRPALFPSLRILIGEDNELNVALLRELLDRRQHRAEFATDGRAVLSLAETGGFDLLLLDLHMPEMDGFQVARAIRTGELETNRHLPIIALTARSTNGDRELCLAAGMDEFLPKPFEANWLWAAVDRVIAAFPPDRAVRWSVLDPGALVRAGGGEAAVLEKLCEVLRRNLPERLARARSALANSDLASLREVAHVLGGSLSVFSTRAALVAATLEDGAGRGEIGRCGALFDRLESICVELLEETRALTPEKLEP